MMVIADKLMFPNVCLFPIRVLSNVEAISKQIAS